MPVAVSIECVMAYLLYLSSSLALFFRLTIQSMVPLYLFDIKVRLERFMILNNLIFEELSDFTAAYKLWYRIDICEIF